MLIGGALYIIKHTYMSQLVLMTSECIVVSGGHLRLPTRARPRHKSVSARASPQSHSWCAPLFCPSYCNHDLSKTIWSHSSPHQTFRSQPRNMRKVGSNACRLCLMLISCLRTGQCCCTKGGQPDSRGSSCRSIGKHTDSIKACACCSAGTQSAHTKGSNICPTAHAGSTQHHWLNAVHDLQVLLPVRLYMLGHIT